MGVRKAPDNDNNSGYNAAFGIYNYLPLEVLHSIMETFKTSSIATDIATNSVSPRRQKAGR